MAMTGISCSIQSTYPGRGALKKLRPPTENTAISISEKTVSPPTRIIPRSSLTSVLSSLLIRLSSDSTKDPAAIGPLPLVYASS